MRQFIDIAENLFILEGEFGSFVNEENREGHAASSPIPYDSTDGFMRVRILPNVIWIDALYASRKGGGRAMLEKVLSYADAHVLPIHLLADGDDGLVSYYEDFGFRRVGWANNEMMRDATGLGSGTPATTLGGEITYDARDGAMDVVLDESGEDEDVAYYLTIASLEEDRPEGAERMIDVVVDYGHGQLYEVRIKDIKQRDADWFGFEKEGGWWVCSYRRK